MHMSDETYATQATCVPCVKNMVDSISILSFCYARTACVTCVTCVCVLLFFACAVFLRFLRTFYFDCVVFHTQSLAFGWKPGLNTYRPTTDNGIKQKQKNRWAVPSPLFTIHPSIHQISTQRKQRNAFIHSFIRLGQCDAPELQLCSGTVCDWERTKHTRHSSN